MPVNGLTGLIDKVYVPAPPVICKESLPVDAPLQNTSVLWCVITIGVGWAMLNA